MRILMMVAVIAFLAGFGCLIAGIYEYKLSRGSSPTPQTISCADLITKGPGNNLHVIVTNFVLRRDAFVVSGGDRKTYWNTAYVPVVPAGDPRDSLPETFGLILIADDAPHEHDLVQLQSTGQLHGMIVNSISGLDLETRDLLRDSYPRTDFEHCLLLEHNREPMSGTGALVITGTGAALLAICFGIGLVARRLNRRPI